MKLIIGLWLLICANMSSWAGDAPLGSKDFSPSPERPVGWRGDGSGHFPGATVPTEFDLGKGHGVVWRTEMPGASVSSPIVVGDRVITVADPHWVICCDAATGTLLWQQDVDPLALRPPAEAAQLRQELAALEKAYATASDAATQKKMTKQCENLARSGAVSAKIKYGAYFGLTYPTPASDGVRVYVHVTAGALAAYDLHGKQAWIVAAPVSGWSMGASSPVVVGDAVILMFGSRSALELAAFDSASGKERWRVPVPNCGHAGSGTPVVLDTSKGKRLALPVKGIVDPSTGALSPHEAWSMIGGSPAAYGDRAAYLLNEYHDKERFFALVQATGEEGPSGAKELLRVPRTSSGSNMASPLIVDGRLYNFDQGHAEIIDLKNGSIIITSTPGEGKKSSAPLETATARPAFGRVPSANWAGGKIVLPCSSGVVQVLDPGVPPKVVGKGMIEPMGGNLFHQGGRMYARTVGALVCLGRKD